MSKKILQTAQTVFDGWRNDWNKFAHDVLKVNLDPQQQEILYAIQTEPRVSVKSGTARGKDFVAATGGICFLFLTPKWDAKGVMIENTKVAMTAPTDRQVQNIMVPEITRLFNNAKVLPGRLVAYDIRTENKEWFLTGFKADENQAEAWSGFHAVHTMFIVTEASGMAEKIFESIEGNLQGDSRMLIVGNPNVSTGYFASSQKSTRWHRFTLDSLNAPNVLQKKLIIPGQVDYGWVVDKIQLWCDPIDKRDFIEEEGDFEFEGVFYRPNDLFRVKVRGMFPKVSQDILVPQGWIDAAIARWKAATANPNYREDILNQVHEGRQMDVIKKTHPLRLGNDVAGMGRDSSAFCFRFGSMVEKFELIQSGGVANHMQIVGIFKTELEKHYNVSLGLYPKGFIDTVGEGAGNLSRVEELKRDSENNKILSNIDVYSVKAGAAARYENGSPYKDSTGYYTFKNLNAYLYWKVREWLDPRNGSTAMLPPGEYPGISERQWRLRSDGSIEIEQKEDLKERMGHSPDMEDSLAVTFYPVSDISPESRLRPQGQQSKKVRGFH